MNPIQQLKASRHHLYLTKQSIQQRIEEMDTAIENAKKEKQNMRLNRSEVEQVMGYSSEGYVSRLNIPFENGLIRFSDLMKWAEKNKANRIDRMRKNIKRLL